MTGKQLAEHSEEVARFAPARLPWHPAIEDKFGELGVNRASWKALTEAVYPSAKTADAVVMALSYCAARKLDPFKRPVHIVPMWDSQRREMVETVWPGISEIRTTAFRTSQYAGCDEVEFGPMMTQTFTGKVGRRGSEEEKSVTVTFPEWGRVNVYRILNGQRCKFVSPKVYWLESYGRQGASDVPNDMWAKRPSGQLEKCVEAAGLRKAFPEEIGNDYSAEEMAGQVLTIDTPATERAIAPPPPAEVQAQLETRKDAPQASGPQQPPPQQEAEDAEIIEPSAPAEAKQEPVHTSEPAPSSEGDSVHGAEQEPERETFNVTAFLESVESTFAGCRVTSDVDEAHEGFADTVEAYLARAQREQYAELHTKALERVGQEQPAPPSGGSVAPPPPADDEEADDGFPVPTPSPAEIYAGKLRTALANCTEAQEPVDLWSQGRDERKKLEADGFMSRDFNKTLHQEVLAVYHRLVEEHGRPDPQREQKPAETAAEKPATEQPAAEGDTAPDTEIGKFTDDLRARIDAFVAAGDTNGFNALIAETQERRDEFQAQNPAAAAAFRPMIQQARKKLAGI